MKLDEFCISGVCIKKPIHLMYLLLPKFRVIKIPTGRYDGLVLVCGTHSRSEVRLIVMQFTKI